MMDFIGTGINEIPSRQRVYKISLKQCDLEDALCFHRLIRLVLLLLEIGVMFLTVEYGNRFQVWS